VLEQLHVALGVDQQDQMLCFHSLLDDSAAVVKTIVRVESIRHCLLLTCQLFNMPVVRYLLRNDPFNPFLEIFDQHQLLNIVSQIVRPVNKSIRL
jgi:hypothetical protein